MSQNSRPYQLNFPDMSRFMDDLNHVLQKGGGVRNFLQKGGSLDFFGIFKSIIGLLLIVLLCYIVFHILFGGYPRVLVNIFTFSFFHKESMDSFMKDNKLFLTSTQTLLYRTNGCDDPYSSIDNIYGTTLSNELYTEINVLDKLIKTSYSEFKYEDQFYEAMKDFYIYYDKVSVKQTIDIITMPEGDIKIQNKEFYEQMLGVFVNKGLYNTKGKGDDQQVIDIYNLDKKQGFAFYKRFAAVKLSMDKIGTITTKIVAEFKQYPYLAFLVLPENDQDHQAFAADYKPDIVKNGKIYDKNASELNNFSWFMIEYLQYKRNPDIFSEFKSQLDTISYNSKEKHTIKKYLNVQLDLKTQAESKIFNRILEKKEPKLIDPSRNNKEELYPQSQRCSPAFFEFVKKHPIFSHVMFSDDVPNDKQTFYTNLLKMYDQFATSCGTSNDYTHNLVKNALPMKKLINAIDMFDMYVNRYKPMITQTYQNQNYANKFFFKRLLEPYYQDFVINRMGTYFKKTFSSGNFKKSYNKFVLKWALLGQLIKNVMKSILNSFHTSTGVQEPAPTDTSG